MFDARESRKSLLRGLVLALCAGFAAAGSTAQPPLIEVSPINFPRTSEDGHTITLTFTMKAQPTANVTLALQSNVPTEGTVSPSSVTFTPATWMTPRTATVTGVDDAVRDFDQAYMIFVGPAVSSDPTYNGLQPANVPMINVDNDSRNFYTLAPCRLFDSRLQEDGPVLQSGLTRTVTAHGKCGIPSIAMALAVNITAVQPTSNGYLTLHSGNDAAPLASNITFGPDQTRTCNAIVGLRYNGSTLSIEPAVVGNGTVHAIIDVVGYFD